MQYIEPGSTSQSLVLYLQDAVTGGPYTTEDQADWTFNYVREGAAAAVADATITAGTLGTWSDGTAKPFAATGLWQIDFADAAFVAGAKYVILLVTHDNGDFLPVSVTIDLSVRQADAVEISGDSTAADNLETMLDGTGGQTLSLGKLAISGNDGSGVVDIDNSGGPAVVATGSTHGMVITGSGGYGVSVDGSTYGLVIAGVTADILLNGTYTIEDSDGNDITQTGAQAALVANNLDHLLLTAAASNTLTNAVNDYSVMAFVMAQDADISAFDGDTDSLEGIAGDNAGAGAIAHVHTTTVASTAKAGVEVWITNSATDSEAVVAGPQTSDSDGKTTFYLDVGTLYLWEQLAGYKFSNPTTITVA